jgi:tetratricopeptide (TPR) repeat protein
LLKGETEEALTEFYRLQVQDPVEAAIVLPHAYVKMGQMERALEAYEQLRSLAQKQYVSKAYLALAVLPLDEDQAFDLLAPGVLGPARLRRRPPIPRNPEAHGA